MGVVIGRVRHARGLLLAAVLATVIAAVALTALADYAREVLDAGARTAITQADPAERALLVQGPAGGTAGDLAERDSAVRDQFADGLAGLDVRVSAAGYAVGRQITGDAGAAVPDPDGLRYASVVFLDGLAEHASLTAGDWPGPVGAPDPAPADPGPAGVPAPARVRAAFAEAAAATLGVTVGDRLEVTDRRTGAVTEIEVCGVWRPRDVTDPYWLLTPGVTDGVLPGSATYGPIVVSKDDFLTGYVRSASAGWLVEPALAGADVDRLGQLAPASRSVVADLPDRTGLGSSVLVTSGLDTLADRLARADLVARSALVTPALMLVVMAGYALLLVAGLLSSHRRVETALLRVRGAGRGRLAGLAVAEAVLVVAPAAVLAPPAAAALLRYADRAPALADGALTLAPRFDAVTWLTAGVAALVCAAAMVVPTVLHSGTYLAELADSYRPRRWAAAQRAGADLALVALAVLGWLQLRQYAAPVAAAGSGRGVDPLLAATPTVAVLAGAVLALRLLPPLTRTAERLVDGRRTVSAVFGVWQAGRRPQAGPVLLLALAVAVSTLAWCLTATADRSETDQADHAVGADLRLVENGGVAADQRWAQVADLPGVADVLPVWRDAERLGVRSEPTAMVAFDARRAGGVMRLRPDLADGSPADLFAGLAAARPDIPVVELPPAARRLSGDVTVAGLSGSPLVPTRLYAVFAAAGGGHWQVPLATVDGDARVRFAVDLPAAPAAPGGTAGPGGPAGGNGPAGPVSRPALAGLLVETGAPPDTPITVTVSGLGTDAGPVDLAEAGRWQGVDVAGRTVAAEAAGQTVTTTLTGAVDGQRISRLYDDVSIRAALAPILSGGVVPVAATGAALAALDAAVGDRVRLSLAQADLEVLVTGVVAAVPGTGEAAALMVDLPSLAAVLFTAHVTIRQPQEWWLATGDHTAAAAAAAALPDVEVLDRRARAADSDRDPYGAGARGALFAAAAGAVGIAGVGVAVAARAGVRRRASEFAVLRALGTPPRQLVRSVVIEQIFLGGLGVAAGLAVGIGVATAMAPLLVLTPSADRPVPPVLVDVAWWPVGATAAGLFALVATVGTLVAAGARHRAVIR